MWPSRRLPARLEPTRGVAQCNYELLRAFNGWMDHNSLRYTLGAGTLLGAMRNEPPGLLQWEHDVDAYVPARAAAGGAARSSCGSRPSRSTAAAGRAAAGASSCTTAARRRASSTSSSSR